VTARRAVAWLLAAFLAWQALAGGVVLSRAPAAASLADRRWAAGATEDERIDAALGSWRGLYRAILASVPEDGIVAVLFPLERETFDRFYRMTTLAHPRRTIPVVKPLAPAELADAVREARRLRRPVYVADVQSGFPIPPEADRVATGDGFVLWRVR
jgi:hypothetical protein